MKARQITKETILDLGKTDRNFPAFNVGDTIEVGQTIKEGDKERVQLFEGDVIGKHNNGISSSFIVRRIGANGVGVEKIFPFYAPSVCSVRVVKTGRARQAKLYYVRERLGKSARIKEQMKHKEATETTPANPA
jgi:large subunit ribosomal protein L19